MTRYDQHKEFMKVTLKCHVNKNSERNSITFSSESTPEQLSNDKITTLLIAQVLR